MRTIMMSLVLAAMSGCATVGKVGANTTNYRVWWKDCGVSRDLPSNIEVFHGQTPSPNTALATAEQLPNPRSNVKGGTVRGTTQSEDVCRCVAGHWHSPRAAEGG